MIHINYPNGKEPDKEWLDKAKALTDELKAAPDKAARDKIIDRNKEFWGELKQWLAEFSDGKCWFTEAKDICSHWHVEHFRPKKEAKDPLRDGYWWLAFDYRNYRLCGDVVNTKKGCFFPLRDGTTAASCPDDNYEDEAALLIDPTVASDVRLLTFVEGGIAVPTEPDGWHRERARKSIERYKLNKHPPLLRARERVWNECLKDFRLLKTLLAEDAKQHSPTRSQKIRDIEQRLQDRAQPTSELSAVARAFLSQFRGAGCGDLDRRACPCIRHYDFDGQEQLDREQDRLECVSDRQEPSE